MDKYPKPEEVHKDMAAEPAAASLQYATELRYGMELLRKVSPEELHNIVMNLTDLVKQGNERPLEEKFDMLFEKWWQETGIYSGPNLCFSNDNFKALKSMGETIIPLIDAKLLTAPTYMQRHLKWLRNSHSKATSTVRCIAI